MSEFYAYLWLREDGTPYYAGKGTGRRAYRSCGHNIHRPKDRKRIVVFPRNSEQDAFKTEKELILNWGRLDTGTGCLRNITDGGDGVSGMRHSKESRERIRQSRTGRKHKESTKQKIREASLQQRHSDETKQKIREIKLGKPSGRKGYHHTPETCEKIRQARLLDIDKRERDDKGRFKPCQILTESQT